MNHVIVKPKNKKIYNVMMFLGIAIIAVGLLGLFIYTSLLFLIIPGLFISGCAADELSEDKTI